MSILIAITFGVAIVAVLKWVRHDDDAGPPDGDFWS
jgi:hypothetical protein